MKVLARSGTTAEIKHIITGGGLGVSWPDLPSVNAVYRVNFKNGYFEPTVRCYSVEFLHMVVQMARFLGDGGTWKRQYTAEPKRYSVVVKKPVCNVILNSSPRDLSVSLMPRGRAPPCASAGECAVPRRISLQPLTCRDTSKMSSFVDDTSSLTTLTATRLGTSERAEAAEASTSPVGGKHKRKRTY
jgi:hypothetical protein